MAGASPPPPNLRHPSWNRGGYRGRGGRPWGFGGRRGARSPPNNNRRIRGNHRSGPQQPQGGRGSFPVRYNQPWGLRNSAHSPRRQNDGNWQRNQYKSPYHGPHPLPPNGQRRISGSPPMRKQGHGGQGKLPHSARDRRDMPPSSSGKGRPYTPPRSFHEPHDSSRPGPPPISAHLLPRSRLLAPIPTRPGDKPHMGRNQQSGGRGPRLQGPRPGGNDYPVVNMHSGGRMSGHPFNSSRSHPKHDNTGAMPRIFSRMAPGLAPLPPSRQLHRPMHRSFSPQRPVPNSHFRGKTGGHQTKTTSSHLSPPSNHLRASSRGSSERRTPPIGLCPIGGHRRSPEKPTSPKRGFDRNTVDGAPSPAAPSKNATSSESVPVKGETVEVSLPRDSSAGASESDSRKSVLKNERRAGSERVASPEKALSSELSRATAEESVPQKVPSVKASSKSDSASVPDKTEPRAESQSSPDAPKKDERVLDEPESESPYRHHSLSPKQTEPLEKSPSTSLPSRSAGQTEDKAHSKSSSPPALRSSPLPKSPSSKPSVPPVTEKLSPEAYSAPQQKESFPVANAKPFISKSPLSSPSLSPTPAPRPAPDLVEAIADVEASIAALRKRIACKKAKVLGLSKEPESLHDASDKKENKGVISASNAGTNDLPFDEVTEMRKNILEAIARSVRETRETEDTGIDYVSPLNSDLSRILRSNQAKAREAADVFRSLCHDPELGLKSRTVVQMPIVDIVAGDALASIRDAIQDQRKEDVQRRKALAKDYVALKTTWRRRLKAVRDKRSKEKREASRDRDRYLLVHTRGASALVTCRTSSGRTSTKVLPGVTPGGSLNNMAEIDSMLADIDHAGGTPGSHHIWGKTLADIPEQDPNYIPFDSGALVIDDAVAELHAARCVNPWTREEKLIFLDKYLLYQKNFRKISTFLEHKSTNDCVRFYYNHKLQYDLKQLLRESSSMKRKGTRTVHLLNLVGLPPTRRSMHMCGIDANGAGSPGLDNEAVQQIGFSAKSVISPREKLNLRAVNENTAYVDSVDRDVRESFDLEIRRSASPPCQREKSRLGGEHLSDTDAQSPSLSGKAGANHRTAKPGQNGKVLATKGSGANATHAGVGDSNQKLSTPDLYRTSPQTSGLEAGEKPRKATWTEKEMEEFDHHFQLFGKDFKKIASLMEKKTPEQVKGYWKMKIRQERESNGKSSRKRHRHRSSPDGSPLHARNGVSRHSGSSARKFERESRKRDAGEAKLIDQRSGHEKRERGGDFSQATFHDSGDGRRGSASPENQKLVGDSSRLALRSKPAGGAGRNSTSPSDRRGRDRERLF